MPPSDGPVAFAKSILGDLDRAFAMAAPVLVMEYEARSERKVPSRWREAFRFEGLTVPVGGDDRNSWDVSFLDLLDPAGHHWTCYFEGGVPRNVTMDG